MARLNKSLIYYVYEHYRPGDTEPFGVGKGHGYRAYVKLGRNPWWTNIINKNGFEVRFVAKNLSELDALWLENICIKGWGRADLGEGPLVNMSDGGEGNNGYRMTLKQREEASRRMSGEGNHMFGKTGKKCPTFGLRGEKSASFGKTGKNHPNSKPVETPLGIFECVSGAAKAHNTRTSVIIYRCRNNKGYRYISDKKNKNKHPLKLHKFPVRTPLGTFESATAAAKAHNITTSAMAYRCRQTQKGCEYIRTT